MFRGVTSSGAKSSRQDLLSVTNQFPLSGDMKGTAIVGVPALSDENKLATIDLDNVAHQLELQKDVSVSGTHSMTIGGDLSVTGILRTTGYIQDVEVKDGSIGMAAGNLTDTFDPLVLYGQYSSDGVNAQYPVLYADRSDSFKLKYGIAAARPATSSEVSATAGALSCGSLEITGTSATDGAVPTVLGKQPMTTTIGVLTLPSITFDVISVGTTLRASLIGTLSYILNGKVHTNLNLTVTAGQLNGAWYLFANAANPDGILSQVFPAFGTAVMLASCVVYSGAVIASYYEGHGPQDFAWWDMHHNTQGTRYGSGADITASVVAGTPTIAITSGSFYDENLKFTISRLAGDKINIWYNLAGVWTVKNASTNSWISSNQYNNAGALSTLTDTYYTNAWIFAANAYEPENQYFVLMDQNQYATDMLARTATLSTMTLTNFPVMESKMIYQVIYQYNAASGSTIIAPVIGHRKSPITVTSTAASIPSSIITATCPAVGWCQPFATGGASPFQYYSKDICSLYTSATQSIVGDAAAATLLVDTVGITPLQMTADTGNNRIKIYQNGIYRITVNVFLAYIANQTTEINIFGGPTSAILLANSTGAVVSGPSSEIQGCLADVVANCSAGDYIKATVMTKITRSTYNSGSAYPNRHSMITVEFLRPA